MIEDVVQGPRFTKLRWTIVGSAVAVAILITALFALDRWRERERLIADAVEDSGITALALAEHTEQVFTAAELLMRSIAGQVNGLHSLEQIDREALHRELRSIAGGAAFIESISILNADGYSVVNSDFANPAPTSWAFREHFTTHRDNLGHHLFIGPPFDTRRNPQTVLPLTIRLTDSTASGKFAGVIYTAVPTNYFIRFYRSLNAAPDSRVHLVLDDGRSLIEEPVGRSKAETFVGTPWFRKASADGFSGAYVGPGLTNDNVRIIAYRKVPSFPLIVTVSIGRDAALVPWKRSTERAAAGLTALLILLAAGCVWLVRLVSERELWAAELRRAQVEAEEANRAKSDFLASMSHEIRTPMNGVLGFAQLLLDSPLDAMQRRHVTHLKDAGTALLAIINDILDVSKIEAGKLTLESIPFSPLAAVDAALSIVRPQAAAKGLRLALDVADDVPMWLTGDPTRLRQILLNLLGNAVKFTESGSVEVKVRREPTERDVRLRFEVVDTGMGISADRQRELFQNFSQLDRSITRRFGGTGLGLAICKRLSEAMGGSIGVRSTAGRGSIFWFSVVLPEAEAPGVAVAPTPVQAGCAARILVAEDIAVNQIIIDSMLRAAGHEVTVVANGREAVEALQREGYDLVFMDMEMPEMDGVSAARAIRALDGPMRDVPIVALSANAMADEVARCRAAGMNDHVSKPIDREALLQVVAAWTGKGARTGSAAGADARPVLDPSVLAGLEMQLGTERLSALVLLFRQQVTAMTESLSAATAHDALARSAHDMISMAGNFGFTELMEASRALVTALRNGAPDVERRVVAFRAAGGRALDAIDARYTAEPAAPVGASP